MTTQSFIKELAKIVKRENVLFSKKDLLAYAYDATQHQVMPEVVVFPRSTDEVSRVMKVAHREKVPVVARGAGTGLSGGSVARQGGIVLELSRMNRITVLDTANRRAIAESGVVNLDLQDALSPLGYFYPPDPASQRCCTLGGNIGENAGGPLCFRYGVTSKYVSGMEVVLADGQIVNLGGDVEDIPGYDLRGLLIGSEGTLGIVTRLTLNILPKPEASRTMLAIFNTLEDAGQSVSDIVSIGIVPAALEIMDKSLCWAIEEGTHAGYPVDAEGVLLIEVAGVTDSLDKQITDISAICKRNRARGLRFAKTSAERDALWKGRKGAFGAVARICPQYIVNDGTVPRGQLVPALHRVGEIAREYHVRIANVAHAGDGNLHPLILFDVNNPEERAAAKKAGEEIMDTCVALGGTISGEHGIGLEKLAAMRRMFSPADLATMRKVKQVFDPDGILNPGKKIPAEADKSPANGQSTLVAAEKAAQPPQAVHQRFAEIVGTENLITDKQKASSYKVDGLVPKAVVFAATTEQVSQIIKVANRAQTAIVPWGSGSKQQAGPCLSAADTILGLKNMKRTIDLDLGNFSVRVEAGKVNSELQQELVEHKLFFPLGPPFMETSTIGGELAANANGPRRFMYGTVRDLVLGLTVVTPTGDIIHPGGKTMKNVAGLDFCRMLIGSQGTLGVITEAILRLFPLPEVNKSLCLVFPNSEDAFRLTGQLLDSILWPSAIELIDWVASRHLDYNSISPRKEGEVMLMVNIEGSSEVVERHLKEISNRAEANQASLKVTIESKDVARVWSAYREIHHSFLSKVPSGFKGKAAVPLSKLGDMFKVVKEAGSKHGMEIGMTGHGGNGVLHTYVVAEKDAALSVITDLRQAAASLGGFFAVEDAQLSVRKSVDVWPRRSDDALVKRLKKALDPNNILSPGRVVGGQH